MSSTTNISNKNEFQIAREYILGCPLLGQDSPAIKAALEGIEKEEKRRIRDAKLRSKFGTKEASKNDTTTYSSKNNNSNSLMNDEIVVVEKDNSNASDSFVLESGNSNNTSMDDMEWQDVQQKDEANSFMEEKDEDESCFLGKTLAKACIESIAQQQTQKNNPVVVSTPLAAIAVALHVALRSEILGFVCTGIPEKKTTGFAPPIRELPKTEFLPRGWDHSTPQSSPDPLRYRKLDTGAVVLTVHCEENNCNSIECRVTFCSAKEFGPCLKFPLDEHINLDSWNAAARDKTKIAPSLHYKNLAGLLSKFCRTFDLGAVQNEAAGAAGYHKPMAGMVNPGYTTTTTSSSSKMKAPLGAYSADSSSNSTNMESRPNNGYTVPTTLDQAFPPAPVAAAAARRRNEPRLDYPPNPLGGDFAGDLLPSGLRDPQFGRPSSGMNSGNLMGPNHPLFAGQGNFPMGGPGNFGGPGTMQPRFDPIVPPCLNTNGNHQNDPRRRRGANGEPNPDHLPPPNSLGNNMFM